LEEFLFKMIRLFIDDNNYDFSNRKYLVDILKPFYPIENLKKYNLQNTPFKIVDSVFKSDYFLLPLTWNYYLEKKKISNVIEIIEKAKCNGKKILIWVSGDYYLDLPESENVIGLYSSPYKSLHLGSSIALPVIIKDPLHFLSLNKIQIKEYSKIPSIGFCGHTDINLIPSIFKTALLIYKRIKFALKIDCNYAGPITPPTLIRSKILKKIEKINKIKTSFIRRRSYQGGEIKNTEAFQLLKKDFYNNIIDNQYTLCIRGTGNFSARFYETLALGRIPIFINTNCVLPFDNIINWQRHIVFIEYDELDQLEEKIINFHKSHNFNSFLRLQEENRSLWKTYFNFEGFMDELIKFLENNLCVTSND
tara:strand:- start:7372 stop:8463 length:1092 start_codon:yes stop_codon:yes gene_type:complete